MWVSVWTSPFRETRTIALKVVTYVVHNLLRPTLDCLTIQQW